MHQSTVLDRHWQKYLLEGIRVVIDQGQDPTEIVDKVIQEATIDLRLDAIDEKREPSGDNDRGANTALRHVSNERTSEGLVRKPIPSSGLLFGLVQTLLGGYPSHTTAFF